MTRKKGFWLIILIIMLMIGIGKAEEAKDITKACRITRNEKKTDTKLLKDRNYNTYYTLSKGQTLEINGKENKISGIFLQYFERSASLEIQVKENNEWISVAEGGTFLAEYFEIEEKSEVRIVNTSNARIFLDELTVYGPGERPQKAATWTYGEKADIMVFVAHPDDEILWFGGMLPTYAGERGYHVQVVYAVKSTPQRRLELLDGLWTCGVKNYPAFLGFADASTSSLKAQYKRWNKNKLYEKVTEVLRKYKPDVVLTQDFSGEYGHGAHRAVADAMSKCIILADQKEKYTESAESYGTWQVKKLYVHLYKKNQIHMDWHQPLQTYEGEDSFSVAVRALKCHVSQVKHGWQMEEGGKNDNTCFGLYYTAVGEDEMKNDIMEHIAP